MASTDTESSRDPEHSDPNSDPPSVVDDRTNHRLVSEVEGAVAELTYELDGDRLILVHTGVPDEIGHHGIAGALVRAAAEWAARDHLTVVPYCPYARRWLRGHPEAVPGLRVDWSGVDERPASEHR